MQTQPSKPAKLPEPITKKAILLPATPQKTVPTLHHYVETRPLSDGGFEFFFECFHTGAIRRWGVWYADPCAGSVDDLFDNSDAGGADLDPGVN